jgi:hypothetical protein
LVGSGIGRPNREYNHTGRRSNNTDRALGDRLEPVVVELLACCWYFGGFAAYIDDGVDVVVVQRY